MKKIISVKLNILFLFVLNVDQCIMNLASQASVFAMKHSVLGNEFYANRRGGQVCEQAIQRIPKRLFGM